MTPAEVQAYVIGTGHRFEHCRRGSAASPIPLGPPLVDLFVCAACIPYLYRVEVSNEPVNGNR